MPYDRDVIRFHLEQKLKGKIKDDVLEKHIEGLIDEMIEKSIFIETFGLTVAQLPTKEEMKWWFQEKIRYNKIETTEGSFEDAYEMKIDEICLKDALASDIFKTFFKYVYRQSEPIPKQIKELLKLNKIKNQDCKDDIEELKKQKDIRYRLNNISIVGVLRLYKMQSKPYLCQTQISTAITNVQNALIRIDKLETEYKQGKEITSSEEIILFDALPTYFNRNI